MNVTALAACARLLAGAAALRDATLATVHHVRLPVVVSKMYGPPVLRQYSNRRANVYVAG